MKKRGLFMLLSIALLVAGCHTQKLSDALTDKVDLLLDSLLANSEMEAVSVGIVRNGQIHRHHKGKLRNGKTPTDETLYEIASLTKTFTGILLAQAIVEKQVSIDDDIRKYLTGSYPNLEFDNQPITFRHLVTHQSGLPRMFPDEAGLFDNPDWDELPFKINALQEGFSKEDFFNALAKVKLDTVPGAKFNYSNAGANLLGYLLEEIYDQPFEQILKARILSPLKMTDTEILLSSVDTARLAYGQNPNKLIMPVRAEKDMNAEGGMFSTVEDMGRYLKFLLDTNNDVVSTAHQPLWNGRYGDFDAGLFWQINKNGDNPDIIFQNGGAYGTSSWITLIPERNLAVFMVTNVSGPDIHQKLSETTEKIISAME